MGEEVAELLKAKLTPDATQNLADAGIAFMRTSRKIAAEAEVSMVKFEEACKSEQRAHVEKMAEQQAAVDQMMKEIESNWVMFQAARAEMQQFMSGDQDNSSNGFSMVISPRNDNSNAERTVSIRDGKGVETFNLPGNSLNLAGQFKDGVFEFRFVDEQEAEQRLHDIVNSMQAQQPGAHPQDEANKPPVGEDGALFS